MPSWNKTILFLLIAIILPSLALFAAVDYTVTIEGVDDETTNLLKSASRLIKLQESPPATLTALKRRSETDVPNFIKVMHSLAYYNAKVDVDIKVNQTPILIQFHIEKGPLYPLKEFQIIPASSSESPCSFSFDQIQLEEIGIVLGAPARPKSIIDAEETLLELLEEESYPLAQITERQVLADVQDKSVKVILTVDTGPFCYFGETVVKGQCSVRDVLFQKKISWCRGAAYDPYLVERTRTALESTGLFSSISITNGDEAPDGLLPMEIHVTEGKHNSIAVGVSYSSDLGPGALLEWENRNVRNVGERLSLKANVALREQDGTILYVIPDFRCRRQDLLLLAEVMREETKGFIAASLSLSAIIEKQVNENTRISYGIMLKQLKDYHTDNNREFNLIKFPAQVRWSDANNILDPSYGQTIGFKFVPSLQVFAPRFAYCINTFSGSIYRPLTRDHRYVFAAKATLGAILGTTHHAIPPSERFYAGSDNLLRGYKYLTVSPLRRDHRPNGGRSMMIYSLELRRRSSESLGWVIFYDFGNVYTPTVPDFHKKVLQSAGIGFRYATPVGPLRLDVAFPFNPRKHVDNRFQIYLSIGQAF
jgi:translocation and assembly module TamA